MRVRVVTAFRDVEADLKRREVDEVLIVSKARASDLVQKGFVEIIHEPETAQMPATETADMPKPRRKRKG